MLVAVLCMQRASRVSLPGPPRPAHLGPTASGPSLKVVGGTSPGSGSQPQVTWVLLEGELALSEGEDVSCSNFQYGG